MNSDLARRIAALAALAAAAVLTAPSIARAQDRVNVTIVAPSLGNFPRLTAGSFDVTNSDQLTSTTVAATVGGTTVVRAAGVDEPPKVQMTLAWGGEVPQLLQAMSSGAAPSPIDHITCDFVHAGSSQPYYTVVIDHPLITHIDLVYDSTSATATEQITIVAPQVEFMDGSASTSSASGSTGSTAHAPGGSMAVPKLRLVATPLAMRQLATISMAAGPPTVGFANFAGGAGNASAQFAPEGTFPAWATGAMTGVNALTIAFERISNTLKVTRPGAPIQAVPVVGQMKPTVASFTKPVGSLSNDLQAAVSGGKRVTTTFELADVPGRLAYSVRFTNALISSDHTSLSNGHATERVTITSTNGLVMTNLRNNVSATLP